MVETNDEWIVSRTGIKERRILKDKDKGTSYLAIKAAEDLINKRGINPEEIDLVLFINGLPLVTMELKNAWTGQNAKVHGQYQYKNKQGFDGLGV